MAEDARTTQDHVAMSAPPAEASFMGYLALALLALSLLSATVVLFAAGNFGG